MRKTIAQQQHCCSVQKTARKNTQYWRNETIFKIGHLAKAIAFAKWSAWVKNYKCQKHAKNHSTRTAELFCAKYGSKKHQILGKKDNLENRPSTKGYSPCQGYSLGNMLSLGQKLKMPKTSEKPFYNTSTVVLCKKHLFCAQNSSKKHQILEKKDNVENRPSTKGYSPCKGYTLCKMVSFDQKWKTPKTCEKRRLELFCAKHRWKKLQIFDKWDDFKNRPSCKGYNPCKGYI